MGQTRRDRGSSRPENGALRSADAPRTAPSDRRCSFRRRRPSRSLRGRSRRDRDRGRSSADSAVATSLAAPAFLAPAVAPKPRRTSHRLRRSPPADATRRAARTRYPTCPTPGGSLPSPNKSGQFVYIMLSKHRRGRDFGSSGAERHLPGCEKTDALGFGRRRPGRAARVVAAAARRCSNTKVREISPYFQC